VKNPCRAKIDRFIELPRPHVPFHGPPHVRFYRVGTWSCFSAPVISSPCRHLRRQNIVSKVSV
jgi:hypothetical protein